MKGIVYKSTGSWFTVKATSGDFYNCRIKGKFRLKGIKSTNPVAVGDPLPILSVPAGVVPIRVRFRLSGWVVGSNRRPVQ